MLTNSVHTCSNFIHPSTHTHTHIHTALISSTHTHTHAHTSSNLIHTHTHRLQTHTHTHTCSNLTHTHIHRLPSHPSTCTQTHTHTLISSIHKDAQNGLTATRAWCSWLGRCPHVPQSCPPTSRRPWVCVSTLQSHHLKQYLSLLTLTPHSAHLKQHLTLLTLNITLFTLIPWLPWCYLKTTNKSARFETFKPFCFLFLTSMWKDFHNYI